MRKGDIEYRLEDGFTKSGKRIIGMRFRPFNDIGNPVTFPIKGSIVLREKPFKCTYQIWTVEGRASIFEETEEDIDFGG